MINFNDEIKTKSYATAARYGRTALHFAAVSVLVGVFCVAPSRADTAPDASQASTDQASTSAPPVMLNLGGYDVFPIHATVGGLTPQERVDQIDSRLTPLLGVASIPPDSVRIFYPDGGYPSIYVFGRRIVTLDKKTTDGEGATSPLSLAMKWAGRFQQILPRVNWRPSNAPAPVIPAHPKVIVATTLDQAGGAVGDVKVAEKLVIRLRGVQPAGMTAAERSDILRSRIYTALRNPIPAVPTTSPAPTVPLGGAMPAPTALSTPALPAAKTPTPPTPALSTSPEPPVGLEPVVTAQPVDPTSTDPNAPSELIINGTPIITVNEDAAVAAQQPTPSALAHSWAKNILKALGYAPPTPDQAATPAPPTTPTTTAATPIPSQPTPPATPAPVSTKPAPTPAPAGTASPSP